MLNAIGLQGIGVHRYIEEKLPELRRLGATNIVNICGSTLDEYVELARILSDAEGVHALEVNISCPNIKEGGITFGCSLHGTFDVVSAVKKVTHLPVMPKLTPNVTDVASIAKAAEDAGADAVSLVNTFLAMAIDVETRRPKLSNIVGGLSGPAIRPIAVRMVYECRRAVKIPDHRHGRDRHRRPTRWSSSSPAPRPCRSARPTSSIPFIWSKLLDGLRDYMQRHGIARVADLVGIDRHQHAGEAVDKLLVALDVDTRRARARSSSSGPARPGRRREDRQPAVHARRALRFIRRSRTRARACSWISSSTTSPTRWRRRWRPARATGAWMMNVHASGGVPMMQAAARAGRRRRRHGWAARGRCVIGVTVLTSMDADDAAAGRRRRGR